MDVFIISSFWQSQIKLPWTYMLKSLNVVGGWEQGGDEERGPNKTNTMKSEKH